jgi:hypothetical protein
MRSQRHLIVSLPFVAGLAALLLFGTSGAQAAKPWTEASLDGAYHFTVSEIRDEAGTLVYCNAYGIMLFDGSGRSDLRESWGYGTCNPDPPGGTPVEDGCFDYVVDADGGVVITERDFDPVTEACTEKPDPNERYVTHCQILDKGQTLLCDGSGGAPGAVVPDGLLLWTATAGKL